MLLERHFHKRSEKDKDILINIIHEGLVMEKPSKVALMRLKQFDFKKSKIYPNNTNIIHHLMSEDRVHGHN